MFGAVTLFAGIFATFLAFFAYGSIIIALAVGMFAATFLIYLSKN